MGPSPSPRTHSSSGAASAVGEGRKGCLFLEMPFVTQDPSTWFYSAASYTRHQTSPRLLCAESFPHGESCLDLPCVFQFISPVRHTDKLKQADFDRAQKEDGGGSARHGRAASPRSPPFPVEIGKVATFPAPGMGVFFPISTHWPRCEGDSAPCLPLAWGRKISPLVAGWGGDGELHDGAPSERGDFATNVS